MSTADAIRADTRIFTFAVPAKGQFIRTAIMDVSQPPLSSPVDLERALQQLLDSVTERAVPRIVVGAPSGRPVVAPHPTREVHVMIPPEELPQPLVDAFNRQIALHPDVELVVLRVPR